MIKGDIMAEIIKIKDKAVDNGDSNSSVKDLQTNFDRLNVDLANRKVTQDIKDSNGNITTTVINNQNITSNKLANGSVNSKKIDKTIATEKFKNQGIESDDIKDDTIDSLDKLKSLCNEKENVYYKILAQRGYTVAKNNFADSYMPGTIILYTRNTALNINETDDIFKGVWK